MTIQIISNILKKQLARTPWWLAVIFISIIWTCFFAFILVGDFSNQTNNSFVKWLIIGLLHLPYIQILILFAFGLTERIGFYFNGRAPSPAGRQPTDPPLVCIQLPMYNEQAVAGRLIKSAAAQQWPIDRLIIQVLDDSDLTTQATVEKICDEVRQQTGVNIQFVHRKDRKGYKAGALEVGRHQTEAEFIAIFDADFLPPSDYLARAIPHFYDSDGLTIDNLGLVQAQWGHLNDDESFLTAAQALWVDDHHTLQQSWRSASLDFVNFTGTAGVWRASALQAVDGWRSASLVEDCEISFRVLFAGYKTKFVKEIIAPSELPQTYDAYRLQQKRWTQGWVQLQRLHLQTLLFKHRTHWKRKAFLTYIMCIGWQWPLWFLWVLILPFLIVTNSSLASFGMDVGIIAYLMPPIIFSIFAALVASLETKYSYIDKSGRSRIGVFRRFTRVFPYMVVNTGMLVHHVCAFIEGLLGPMHCEFERTPKTGSVTTVAIDPNGTTSRNKPAKSIRKHGKSSYLITELVFLTTQCIWTCLFAFKGMFFAAAGALWIVTCTIGIRVAPLAQAYLQRKPVQKNKVFFNIWGTLRFLLFLVLTIGAETVNGQDSRADKAVELARQEAQKNNHIEAIKAYRRAIEAEPKRRREWLIEYADQLTWAGRLGVAIKLYSEAMVTDNEVTERLARRGLARALSWDGRHSESITEYKLLLARDPTNHELQLALAEVLSWDNRLRKAVAQYKQVLRDHPNDIRALRGKDRILSWRGRHRKVVVDMQEILRQHPYDREATLILSESLYWMGRLDRATLLLQNQLAADPHDKRAAQLLEEIQNQQRPEAKIDFLHYTQSDNMRIMKGAFDTKIPIKDARGFIGARYNYSHFEPYQSNIEKITVSSPAAYAGFRASDALNLNARISIDLINTDGVSDDHIIPTFESYITYLPNDILRFDVGASRMIWDSEKTLLDGMAVTKVDASMDINPNELTKLSARISWATHTDGNECRWWQFQANQRVFNQPRVFIGYRYTYFSYLIPWQEGYYNPDRYNTHQILFQGSDDITPQWYWNIRITAGYETELPNRSRLTLDGGLGLEYKLSSSLEIEMDYNYFTSRTVLPGGFARSVGRLTLSRRF